MNDPDEVAELGLGDAARSGAVLIEWPERGHGFTGLGEVLAITFADDPADPHRRHLTLTPSAAWAGRVGRIAAIAHFLDAHCAALGFSDARIDYLQGDASPRSYARLTAGVRRAILMDAPRQPDGPPIRDGLPYSRIAHLAEDVRPFVAIDGVLRDGGLSAPEIYRRRSRRGPAADRGPRRPCVRARSSKAAHRKRQLWRAATDVLVAAAANARASCARRRLRRRPHRLPDYDRRALSIETELLLDWYWPALHGAPAPAERRAEFNAMWDDVFDRLLAMPRGLGAARLPLAQPDVAAASAQASPTSASSTSRMRCAARPAYDLVSLLQDARLDVAPELEAAVVRALLHCRRHAPNRASTATPSRFAYAALGAQRNTKILGIFARLARRDGKPQYLRHIPRIWGYLARDLAHPGLAGLARWYDRHLPAADRARSLLDGLIGPQPASMQR